MSLKPLLSPYSCCPHAIITIGKGGVGKTTISLLLGLALSDIGKTLVLSLDPARHLVKYVGVNVLGKEVPVSENLVIKQVDIEREINEQLEQYSRTLDELLPSLKVLNIDNVVEVVKYMPGAEEEALLKIVMEVYENDKYEFIIIDTPPTGVTLRTLYLPSLYMVWLEKLIEVRTRILSLRYAIARALGREAEIRDKALSLLLDMRERYKELLELLRDTSRTSYVPVTTPEPLPMYELRETVTFLERKLRTRPKFIVLNRLLAPELASSIGISKSQEESVAELSSYGVPLVLVNYLGRPTESLDDVRELFKVLKVMK